MSKNLPDVKFHILPSVDWNPSEECRHLLNYAKLAGAPSVSIYSACGRNCNLKMCLPNHRSRAMLAIRFCGDVSQKCVDGNCLECHLNTFDYNEQMNFEKRLTWQQWDSKRRDISTRTDGVGDER